MLIRSKFFQGLTLILLMSGFMACNQSQGQDVNLNLNNRSITGQSLEFTQLESGTDYNVGSHYSSGGRVQEYLIQDQAKLDEIITISNQGEVWATIEIQSEINFNQGPVIGLWYDNNSYNAELVGVYQDGNSLYLDIERSLSRGCLVPAIERFDKYRLYQWQPVGDIDEVVAIYTDTVRVCDFNEETGEEDSETFIRDGNLDAASCDDDEVLVQQCSEVMDACLGDENCTDQIRCVYTCESSLTAEGASGSSNQDEDELQCDNGNAPVYECVAVSDMCMEGTDPCLDSFHCEYRCP